MAAYWLLMGNLSDLARGTAASLAVAITPVAQPAPALSCGAPSKDVAMMVATPETRQQLIPARATTRAIQRADDGLFYIDGVVNGAKVRFLIDTGATTIVLTRADATRVGVLPASFDTTASTAGGPTAMARVRLTRLAIGDSLDFNVAAAVADEGLTVSLLGASWLTQIASLTISGDRMVLQ